MDTYFAPAERADPVLLEKEIEQICTHPVCDVLLQACNGIVLVLNEQRQIVGLNSEILEKMGFEQPETMLGLRPGEALACDHFDEEEGGCGTSKFCRTCGAAIAILASQKEGQACERECIMSAEENGQPVTRAFTARCSPLVFDQNTFTILTLLDIQATKNLEALQRVFFHDLNNTITSLLGVSDLMLDSKSDLQIDLAREIELLTVHLSNQIASQYHLWDQISGSYKMNRVPVSPKRVLAELKAIFRRQEVASNKELMVPEQTDSQAFYTDPSLLHCVLINMVKNALEATEVGGRVRLWSERHGDQLSFYTWNQGQLPEEVALKVFQRYFTTKSEPGRGVGTYSMKLLGEEYLGGKVGFNTSSGGTVFHIHLNSSEQFQPDQEAGQAQNED